MPINFVPRRKAILICDFDLARIPPEIDKTRRVIVVSPREFNHLHARSPGLCQVVPLSATLPNTDDGRSVFIPTGRYRSLTENVWAKAGAVATVSHLRLERPFVQRRYHSEYVSDEDMVIIEKAIRIAFGLIWMSGGDLENLGS